MEKKLVSTLPILPLTCRFHVPPIAQVDVLSAALRASSLDAREEASDAEKRSDMQDELGVNELPNCKINHTASVPLISDAVEVMHSVKCLSSEKSFQSEVFCWGIVVANHFQISTFCLLLIFSALSFA